MHEARVILLVERAAAVEGVPATSDDPPRPHSHLIVDIAMIIAWCCSLYLVVLRRIVLKFHILVPLEIKVSVGKPRAWL